MFNVNVIEIKTPNCNHCKAIEPEYIKLKEKFSNIDFKELVFGIDDDAKKYVQQFNIRSAPTFIAEYTNEFGDIISQSLKFEELEDFLNQNKDK